MNGNNTAEHNESRTWDTEQATVVFEDADVKKIVITGIELAGKLSLIFERRFGLIYVLGMIFGFLTSQNNLVLDLLEIWKACQGVWIVFVWFRI